MVRSWLHSCVGNSRFNLLHKVNTDFLKYKQSKFQCSVQNRFFKHNSPVMICSLSENGERNSHILFFVDVSISGSTWYLTSRDRRISSLLSWAYHSRRIVFDKSAHCSEIGCNFSHHCKSFISLFYSNSTVHVWFYSYIHYHNNLLLSFYPSSPLLSPPPTPISRLFSPKRACLQQWFLKKLLTVVLNYRFRRRTPYCLFMLIGGVACLLVLAVPKGVYQLIAFWCHNRLYGAQNVEFVG